MDVFCAIKLRLTLDVGIFVVDAEFFVNRRYRIDTIYTIARAPKFHRRVLLRDGHHVSTLEVGLQVRLIVTVSETIVARSILDMNRRRLPLQLRFVIFHVVQVLIGVIAHSKVIFCTEAYLIL